jgi:hypothetical protein
MEHGPHDPEGTLAPVVAWAKTRNVGDSTLSGRLNTKPGSGSKSGKSAGGPISDVMAVQTQPALVPQLESQEPLGVPHRYL